MIKPYTAVGLVPTVRGIRKRKDIMINLEHLSHLVKAASWLSSLDLPVRLIAFPEGALQAFNDEVLDLDHATFARECAIDIPGEETEALGKIAIEERWNISRSLIPGVYCRMPRCDRPVNSLTWRHRSVSWLSSFPPLRAESAEAILDHPAHTCTIAKRQSGAQSKKTRKWRYLVVAATGGR